MLIKCPKCRSVYDIADTIINEDGLKMHCSQCSEIWLCYPQDALKKTSITPKNIQKFFKHVSKQTDNLFHDETKIENISKIEKMKIANTYKRNYPLNFILLIFAILSIITLLYALRFDIVRLFPQTENIYSKLHIASIPYGTDLEFNNITTEEYVENNISKIKISGSISNQSKYTVELPPLKIDIYDKTGKLLLSIIEPLSLPRLESGYHILFNKTINNPTPLTKSIYVNFADKKI